MTLAAGIEPDHPLAAAAETRAEDLVLPGPHWRLVQVALQDGTDHHNELVAEREWLLHPRERPLELAGNVFVATAPGSGSGIALVRQAPLPHARAVTGFDLRVEPTSTELRMRTQGDRSEWARIPFDGGRRGCTAALQAWQRSLRPDTPVHRVPAFITNTWGDRNRDARICHDFVAAEIRAAARLGADAMQIDDGWQAGRSGNTADPGGGHHEGFRAARPDFWEPDPGRFPQGLEPLVALGHGLGVGIGLWFAPDRSDGNALWRQDADTILGLHRRYGVRFVKIDFVDTSSTIALANFGRLADAVRAESQGQVALEFDCTAGKRPGYFGVPHGAPLFIENRYTDWHHYWPHHTLRNLWSLAWWIDPLRIRMEFLNPRRNRERYGDDALAPDRYDADALFAGVMAANPLGWFEASNLDGADAEAVAAVAAVWRREREAMAACAVEPVGRRPDGHGWSGFRWWRRDEPQGYVLALRGLGDETAWRLPLDDRRISSASVIAGDGRATLVDGDLRIDGVGPLRYALVRLDG